MNNIQEFDYSLDFLQSILWQYNDAENIAELLQKKQDWYTENHTNFWNDWVTDVFDLRTANDFGLNVWSIILDLPLYGDQEPSPVDYPAFGFGAFGLNFGNGNFATDADGFTGLSIQEKRILLQLKFFSLVNDATVPTINEFLNYLFGDNYVYVVDNYNMTMEYVFVQDPGRRLLNAMTALDVLPRPSAVSLDVETQNTIMPPNSPTALNATVVDDGGDLEFDNIQLDWTAPTLGFPFTYNVYRNSVLIASNVVSSTYLDNGLAAGPYQYTVSATNISGEGSNSNLAFAVISSGSTINRIGAISAIIRAPGATGYTMVDSETVTSIFGSVHPATPGATFSSDSLGFAISTCVFSLLGGATNQFVSNGSDWNQITPENIPDNRFCVAHRLVSDGELVSTSFTHDDLGEASHDDAQLTMLVTAQSLIEQHIQPDLISSGDFVQGQAVSSIDVGIPSVMQNDGVFVFVFSRTPIQVPTGYSLIRLMTVDGSNPGTNPGSVDQTIYVLYRLSDITEGETNLTLGS